MNKNEQTDLSSIEKHVKDIQRKALIGGIACVLACVGFGIGIGYAIWGMADSDSE